MQQLSREYLGLDVRLADGREGFIYGFSGGGLIKVQLYGGTWTDKRFCHPSEIELLRGGDAT